MPFPDAKLLRIHCTESDRYGGAPLYEALVAKCRALELAGATVFRGLEGYGHTAEIHRPHVVGHDLPVIVMIVDSAEKIDAVLPELEDMVDRGVIVVSEVEAKRVVKGAPPA